MSVCVRGDQAAEQGGLQEHHALLQRYDTKGDALCEKHIVGGKRESKHKHDVFLAGSSYLKDSF